MQSSQTYLDPNAQGVYTNGAISVEHARLGGWKFTSPDVVLKARSLKGLNEQLAASGRSLKMSGCGCSGYFLVLSEVR